MELVNFPAIIANYGELNSSDIDPNKDLLVIGKQVNNLRDGSQYQNRTITVDKFLQMVPVPVATNYTTIKTIINLSVNDDQPIALPTADFYYIERAYVLLPDPINPTIAKELTISTGTNRTGNVLFTSLDPIAIPPTDNINYLFQHDNVINLFSIPCYPPPCNNQVIVQGTLYAQLTTAEPTDHKAILVLVGFKI